MTSAEVNYNKKNGSYYTPPIMADFIIKRLFDKDHFEVGGDINILEPSAGDGIFISSLITHAISKKKIKSAQIDIVEKNNNELKKVENIKKNNPVTKKVKFNFYNVDFLKFQNKNKTKYDLVIANPPYIKKNYLTKDQLDICRQIHDSAELSKNRIKNIWTAFLISAVKNLNDKGAIGFVLPAEFLQVSFTAEIRDFIIENFNKIEIFAFNELVFQGAEQDVIVILASKNYPEKVVSFYQAEKIESLKRPDLISGNSNTGRETLSKWTNYILSPEDLDFLEELKSKFKNINDYCTSQVGIVTAANDFFILNSSTAREYKITRQCKPILQKSSLIKDVFLLKKENFEKIKKSDKPCYLLTLNEEPKKDLSKDVVRYLKRAEDKEINKRYKCKLRKYWYSVPSVWPSEGFFTKRTDKTPRIIVNEANVNVTDAFYRIKMFENFDIKSLSFCFYNTFSFIYSELEGRFYGGGVLELTPNEFKKIPVPYMSVNKQLYNEFISIACKQKTGNEARNFVDQKVLNDYYKISKQDIKKLNIIYEKLYYRRLKK